MSVVVRIISWGDRLNVPFHEAKSVNILCEVWNLNYQIPLLCLAICQHSTWRQSVIWIISKFLYYMSWMLISASCWNYSFHCTNVKDSLFVLFNAWISLRHLKSEPYHLIIFDDRIFVCNRYLSFPFEFHHHRSVHCYYPQPHHRLYQCLLVLPPWSVKSIADSIHGFLCVQLTIFLSQSTAVKISRYYPVFITHLFTWGSLI